MNATTKYFAGAILGFSVLSFIAPVQNAAPIQTSASSAPAAKKLRFAGLVHTTTGAAGLGDRLVLSNIGATGDDGVRIRLGRVRGWSADRLRAVPKTLDWSMTFMATGRRGGRRVQPVLNVQELGDSATDRFLIGFAPSFGASTYRIEVYDGDSQVYSATDFDSGDQGVFASNDAICDAIGKSASVALGICEWVVSPDFQQNDDGECEWSLTGQTKRFFFRDGTEVEGDRIRFIENLTSSPQRAMFNTMHIQAAHLRSMTIDDESVLRRRRFSRAR